jgi:hypothetical protein
VAIPVGRLAGSHLGFVLRRTGSVNIKHIAMIANTLTKDNGNLHATDPFVNDMPKETHRARDNPVPQYIPKEET